MARFALADVEWELIWPLLPTKPRGLREWTTAGS